MTTTTKKRPRKKGRRFTWTEEKRKEALSRAEGGESERNYDALFEGFAAKGIDIDRVIPRENVFTYNAWLALGRQVRKGETGVRLPEVFIPVTKKDEDAPNNDKKKKKFMRIRPAAVFHVSQTDPIPGWTGKLFIDPAAEDDEEEEE